MKMPQLIIYIFFLFGVGGMGGGAGERESFITGDFE